MAKFVFRLQSLLSIKEKLEEQKELEYGRAVKALETEKCKEQALRDEQQEKIEDFRDNIDLKIEPEDFKRYNLYIDLLKKRITAQQKVVAEAEKAVLQKREALIIAMRERKTLDLLKEKDLEEYRIEEQRLEQKVVDQVVSFRFSKD